jgi:hypothetical protein
MSRRGLGLAAAAAAAAIVLPSTPAKAQNQHIVKCVGGNTFTDYYDKDIVLDVRAEKLYYLKDGEYAVAFDSNGSQVWAAPSATSSRRVMQPGSLSPQDYTKASSGAKAILGNDTVQCPKGSTQLAVTPKP